MYACLRGQPREALLAVARDFSPRVMVASGTEVLLDVSGLGRLIGEPPDIARALAHAMFDAGLQASVAVAPTQTAARLLATQLPDYPITRLSDLPIDLLRPLETLAPAVNDRDRVRPYETLERWGIATLGDLAALPAAGVASRLGRRGAALQRLARGLDPRPFVPDGETPRFTGRLELEWPIDALEPLSFVLARLLDPLSAALERADRGAIAVRVDLRLTDRTTHARVLPLPAPMRDPRVLRTLVLLDLESHPPSPLRGFGETGPAAAGIDAIAIELDPTPGRIVQFSLLERALPSPEALATLTARLSALVGESRVGSAVLLDSHAPDAFDMARFAPEGAAQGAWGAQGPQGAGGVHGAGRAPGAVVLRRQRLPPAIRVAVERGRPVHIAASRRGMPCGAITEAAGPWRASGGWWNGTDPVKAEGKGPRDRAAERAAGNGPWDRDEWDVLLVGGAVCRIFRDRRSECWFFEGTYD